MIAICWVQGNRVLQPTFGPLTKLKDPVGRCLSGGVRTILTPRFLRSLIVILVRTISSQLMAPTADPMSKWSPPANIGYQSKTPLTKTTNPCLYLSDQSVDFALNKQGSKTSALRSRPWIISYFPYWRSWKPETYLRDPQKQKSQPKILVKVNRTY